MAPATERTSLLGRISKSNNHTPTEAGSSGNAIIEEDDMEILDEPVDVSPSSSRSSCLALVLLGVPLLKALFSSSWPAQCADLELAVLWLLA